MAKPLEIEVVDSLGDLHLLIKNILPTEMPKLRREGDRIRRPELDPAVEYDAPVDQLRLWFGVDNPTDEATMLQWGRRIIKNAGLAHRLAQ